MSAEPQEASQPPTKDDAFWRGVRLGELSSAKPATDAVVDSETLTTGRSPWLGVRCAGCQQTFRRGDRVRVAAGGSVDAVRHLMPHLSCPPLGHEDGGEIGAPADVDSAAPARNQFAEGLQSVWPALNDAPVFRLTAGSWQVARPGSGPTTPTCPGCGHTFRSGDVVIVCPCAGGDDDPRRGYCQVTVHRDPAHGLNCWDDWAPAGRLRRCPRTLELLDP